MEFFDNPEHEWAASHGRVLCQDCSREVGYVLDKDGVEHRPAYLAWGGPSFVRIVCQFCAEAAKAAH